PEPPDRPGGGGRRAEARPGVHPVHQEQPGDQGELTPALPTAEKKGTRGSPSSFPPVRARSLGQELDPRDLGAVAGPVAELQDPGVAPGPAGEPGADLGEEPGEHRAVLDLPLHLPPGVQVAPPGQGDEPLGEGPELLGLGLRGDDAAVLAQAGGHVVHQGLLVARRAGELAALGAMPHQASSSTPATGRAVGMAPGSATTRAPSASVNRIPKLSPSRRSRSPISASAFSPTFLTLSRSSSVNSTRSRRVRMFEFLSELSERTERPRSSIGRATRCARSPDATT